MAEKRVNKSKEELLQEIEKKRKYDNTMRLAKAIFPLLSKQKTVYDAQTALQAISGFITYDMQKKADKLRVSDLEIDLSKEESSEIKKAMIAILVEVNNEPAKETSDFMLLLSNVLGNYGTQEFLKKPMKSIKMEDIIK